MSAVATCIISTCANSTFIIISIAIIIALFNISNIGGSGGGGGGGGSPAGGECHSSLCATKWIIGATEIKV